MVYNAEKRDLATYYRQRGFSYSEISRLCGVSKSTVYNWFAHEAFSQSVRDDNAKKARFENQKRLRLLNKAKQRERAQRYQEAIRTADVEYVHYKANPLFIAGLTLYLSHGDIEDEHVIRFRTSKIEFQRIFINFLTQYLGVSRSDVRMALLLPEINHEDETKVISHWAKTLRISPAQFYKTQKIAATNTGQALQNGVGNTIINSTLLKKKLQRWIKLVEKQLQKYK